MKRQHFFLAGVMYSMLFFHVHAQSLPPTHKLLPEKALLFNKLPEQFKITNLLIEKLFAGPDTGTVIIPITANSFFEGVIIDKVQKNRNVTNINIKSTNYDGALLSVSKITYNDLTTKYNGRIISIHYGDVFLLTQENNTLYFKKKKQSTVITE